MTFHSIIVQLKNTTDEKEISRVIFDFFIWQYNQALGNEINTRCELNAYLAANEAAKREYQEANELGWGPKLPYDDIIIDNKKRQVEETKKSLTEAKAFLNFIRDRFVDKFV